MRSSLITLLEQLKVLPAFLGAFVPLKSSTNCFQVSGVATHNARV